MSTQIKRLYQNNEEFVPITLAEAVVVNGNNIAGLNSKGITTLEKVLGFVLGVTATNASDIDTLETLVNNINTALASKQNKLTAGAGIEISDTGVISTTTTGFAYKIVTELPSASEECENIIYLLANESSTDATNLFIEYVCVKFNNSYKWEKVGEVQSTVDLSGYVTRQEFLATAITAENVTRTDGTEVTIDWAIPATLYDN